MEDKILYIKGFNAGYQLSKHEPELLNKLLKSENEKSDYVEAMRLGKKQYDREKIIEQMKQASKQKNKDRDLE